MPKDLRALISSARSLGWSPPTLEAALKVNDDQILVIAEKLEARLGGLRGKKVAILGLTFKPDTADFRDSPAMSLGLHLSKVGVDVRATDPALDQVPQATKNEFKLFTDNEDAWAYDGDDGALIEAMKRGRAMVVRGQSWRGTKTKDHFSLRGFTKSYQAISDACDLP